MQRQDDELSARFQGLTRIPFSEELAQGVLEAARQQPTVRRSRVYLWRTISASVGGVAAASVLAWGAWNYGAGVNPSSGDSMQSATQKVTVSQPLSGLPDYGLQLAPVSVSGPEQVPSSGPGTTKMIRATLTNMGTETIQPSDVIGVLSFSNSKASSKNLLGPTDFIAFVNSTDNQPLVPGQPITWLFNPIGPTYNNQGRFIDKPKLAFLRRGLVLPEQADVVWHKAPFRVTDIVATPKSVSDASDSITMTARITNHSSRPVALSDVLAIVWFSDTSGGDWTAVSGSARFFTRVARQQTIEPGGTTVVSFISVIGPKSNKGQIPHLSLILQ